MKSLFIITGASRGLGRAFTRAIARTFSIEAFQGCDLILNSTKLADLESLKEELIATNHRGNIQLYACDWSDRSELAKNCENLCSLVRFIWLGDSPRDTKRTQAQDNTYDLVVLINNHGTLGPLVSIDQLVDRTDEVFKHIDINITSALMLTAHFVKYFNPTRATNLRIVNISSLAAVKPFETWSLYCTAKAARDMLYRVVAAEAVSADASRIKTISYAPGPCDTDMQSYIRETATYEPQRDMYINMKNEGKLVKPEDSAEVLAKLLLDDGFESGAHIDYFEIK